MSAISTGPGWRGLHLETGATANGWDGDDLMVDGHFLAMNSADEVLHFEMRSEDDSTWQSFTREPGAFWIHPEGRPFSLRHQGRSHFSAAIIDGKFLDSVMNEHYELRAGFNVVDKVLEHLFRALIEELQSPSPPHVRESLIRSFVLMLGARHGLSALENPCKKGLSTAQFNVLLQWVDHNLDTRITVGKMASHVGLSVAHFSREFKRATGATPWDYIVGKRLQRASTLLRDGKSACDTAAECGFFDQAHLSRLFKQRFGMSPSVYARQDQRQRAMETAD